MKDNLWWEFYIIRYSMGTIVGAVIVYALLKSNPELSQFLLLPKDNKLEYFHFIFLAFYGLTYCYIASAPILVWHASRFAFSYEPNGRIFRPIWFVFALIFVSATLLTVFLIPDLISFAKVIIAFLFLFIVIPQWILIFYAVSKISENYSFYKRLSEKRKSDQTDIRESYKHLREHGNSFGILFLEILMGALLISFGYENLNYSLGFIFLWILPAVCVWFVGTGLENKFVTEQTKPKNPTPWHIL